MHQRDTSKPTRPPAEQRPKARPGQAADEQEHEPAQHQGATETEVAPTTPPMRGPGDLVGETDEDDDEIDPAEELTPG
jgi:hypothetical protein